MRASLGMLVSLGALRSVRVMSPFAHALPSSAPAAKVYVAATMPLLTVHVPHFLRQWAAQVTTTLSHTLGNDPHDGSDAGALASACAGPTLPAMPVSEGPETWDGLLLAAPKKKVSHSRKAMRSANKGLKDRISTYKPYRHATDPARPSALPRLCAPQATTPYL